MLVAVSPLLADVVTRMLAAAAPAAAIARLAGPEDLGDSAGALPADVILFGPGGDADRLAQSCVADGRAARAVVLGADVQTARLYRAGGEPLLLQDLSARDLVAALLSGARG